MHEFRAPDGPFHGVWQPERPDVVKILVTTAWRFAAGRWVVTGEAH